MRKVLITGISGFIGGNLVHAFKGTTGVQIFGHSRNPVAQLPVQWLSDISAGSLDDAGIDTVIHLAGIAHDLKGKYTAADYQAANVDHAKSVFDAFRESGATRFIFFSSIKVVADTAPEPLDESAQALPLTEYGKSKRRAEEYLLSVALPDVKRFYIFRPCMIHGPDNKGNLNALLKFVRMPVPYPFGSFNNQRSFLSMENLIAIIRTFMYKDIPSGIFHLADNGYLSTRELYELICGELGKKPWIWNLPPAVVKSVASAIGKQDVLIKLTEDMKVSNAKLLQYLEEPLPVDIREGLRRTIRSMNG